MVPSISPCELSLNVNDDTRRLMFLCRIAHIVRKLHPAFGGTYPLCFHGNNESEQLRSVIFFCAGDHGCRDDRFLSLFQVL